MENIVNDILAIKESQNACILAHNYQPGEIQDVADFVGDSLELSNLVTTLPHSVIVFCGVSFMAEAAKILSPDKTILLPEPSALCDCEDRLKQKRSRDSKNTAPHAAVTLLCQFFG